MKNKQNNEPYCLTKALQEIIKPLFTDSEFTGGNIYDSECAIELLSKVNLAGKTVLDDKAFCSARIREFIQV